MCIVEFIAGTPGPCWKWASMASSVSSVTNAAFQ
jgi:hypothetical protein